MRDLWIEGESPPAFETAQRMTGFAVLLPHHVVGQFVILNEMHGSKLRLLRPV